VPAIDVARERLADRRAMWNRFRETGELPRGPEHYVAEAAAARRQRRERWWLDLEDDPPGNAPARVGVPGRSERNQRVWFEVYRNRAVAA
jgi:hypothetical protein